MPPPVYRMIPGIVQKANAAHRTYALTDAFFL
jgi:hypothetical protein